jgi:hypothetical protein
MSPKCPSFDFSDFNMIIRQSWKVAESMHLSRQSSSLWHCWRRWKWLITVSFSLRWWKPEKVVVKLAHHGNVVGTVALMTSRTGAWTADL